MRKGDRKRIAELRGEMVRLYQIVGSCKEVARRLSISDGPVLRAVKDAGFDISQGRSDEERFWDYVSPEPMSGCWLWIGGLNSDGYAHLSIRDSSLDFPFRKVPTYRWYYEHLHGPVEPGLEIDHKCRNRACVNPDHMEPVTRYENHLRAPNSLLNRMNRGEIMGALKNKVLREVMRAWPNPDTFYCVDRGGAADE